MHPLILRGPVAGRVVYGDEPTMRLFLLNQSYCHSYANVGLFS